MGRMIFDLTDDDRDALERVRVKLGARSQAEALRILIRREGGEPVMAETPGPKPSFSHGRGKTVVAPVKRTRVDVQVGPRKFAPGERLKKR